MLKTLEDMLKLEGLCLITEILVEMSRWSLVCIFVRHNFCSMENKKVLSKLKALSVVSTDIT